jgi:2,3-bisphosphoglycerate-independent phosphoglycerate mutase
MALELKKNDKFAGRKGPLLLIIMDGVGIGKNDATNAVYMAKTPVLDRLMASRLYTQLRAHGPAVGLPSEDDMGNSEVGHNALGAGRVFEQGAKLVNSAIETGKIYESDTWKAVTAKGSANAGANNTEGGTVHFIGLLSDGNVHSHIKHLFALIEKSAALGVKKVRVHPLLDGRDVGEKSALSYIKPLEELLAKIITPTGI